MERCLPVAYGAVFLWGIAVLLGMVGLGRLVALAVGSELAKKAGWGLHAVWGVSAYLFIGGLLGVFGLCDQTCITLMIVLGLTVTIWTTFRGVRSANAAFAAVPWCVWPAFALAALTYAAGICHQAGVNDADDLAAYFHFCEKLLETGSFDDPFSWRRLASLGGHTLLQSSVLAQASWANAQAFEIALCPAILVGLILGFRGGVLSRSPLGLLLALIAVTTPIIRVNTASHFTGVILLFGLFSTLDMIDGAGVGRRRLLAVAGMVGAGLCSLRAQDVPAGCGALGLFWLASWIKDRRPSREAFIEAVYWGAGLFVALLPWMIMSFRSSGSPLFPLVQGNNNLAFNPLSGGQPLVKRLDLLFQMIVHPALLPLWLCLIAAPAWKKGVAAWAVSISAVLVSLALAYSISLIPDTITVPRYVQPLLLSGALAVLIARAASSRSRWIATVVASVLLIANIRERSRFLLDHYAALSRTAGLKMPASFSAGVVADHRDAQSLIPEGRRILVCTDFPFLFDYRRNPVWIIDLPHAASPPPGLPFLKPPEETKRYLRSLGIDYVIYPDFSATLELNNRASWKKLEKGNVLLYRIEAPFWLDYFDTMDRLAQSETVLGRMGNLTVLHLNP